MNKEFWYELQEKCIDYLIAIGPKALFAIIILVLGVFAIKILMRVLKRILENSDVCDTSPKLILGRKKVA